MFSIIAFLKSKFGRAQPPEDDPLPHIELLSDATMQAIMEDIARSKLCKKV